MIGTVIHIQWYGSTEEEIENVHVLGHADCFAQ